jgi:hypothetical protein
MTIRVELNAEIEAQLVAEARVQGIPLEKVAERLLQEALASRSVPQGNLTLEGFHAMLSALSAGSERLRICRPRASRARVSMRIAPKWQARHTWLTATSFFVG